MSPQNFLNSRAAYHFAPTFPITTVRLLTIGALVLFTGCNMGLPNPLAHFEVVNFFSDDSCSSLFDYCQQVTCTVKNTGLVGGIASVELSLQAGGQTIYSSTQPVSVPAGEMQTVLHQFTEVSLLGQTGSTSLCVVR